MIEVNDYVRTKDGIIYKIENGEEFYEDSVDVGMGIIPDVDGIWIDRECLDYIDKRDIVKHNKQLIDLIENKDVLKVRIDKTIMVFGIDEDTSDIKYKELIENIENGEYELLEILTHEQFEANCYKVGGEE